MSKYYVEHRNACCHSCRFHPPELQPLLQDALPLHELFVAVDKHLAARQAAAGSLVMLGQRATQYRAVQKRLLVRFKDRNPAPMAHLDTLLEDTYSQLLEVGEQQG